MSRLLARALAGAAVLGPADSPGRAPGNVQSSRTQPRAPGPALGGLHALSPQPGEGALGQATGAQRRAAPPRNQLSPCHRLVPCRALWDGAVGFRPPAAVLPAAARPRARPATPQPAPPEGPCQGPDRAPAALSQDQVGPGAVQPAAPVRALLRRPRAGSPALPARGPDQHDHPEGGERGPRRARPPGEVRQAGHNRPPGPRGGQGPEGQRGGHWGAVQEPLRRLLGGPQEAAAQQRLLPDADLRHRVRQPLRPLQHVHGQVLLLRARGLLLQPARAHLEPEGDLPAPHAQRGGGRGPVRPGQRPQHHAEPEHHAGAAGAGRGLGAALQGRAGQRHLQRRLRHLRHLQRAPGQVQRGPLSACHPCPLPAPLLLACIPDRGRILCCQH